MEGFYQKSEFNILNRLFTRKSLLDLIYNRNNKIYEANINKFLPKNHSFNNKSIISHLYSIFNLYYRNEYFYKNTILNELLLKKHNIQSTIALNELPIDKSIADFILINGKATVYEIKSEVDNIERLESQINNYFKAFTQVYVITYKENILKIENKIENKNVGIILLNKDNSIEEIKEAKEDFSRLSNEVIFKILRKSEYEQIIFNNYNKLPNVSQIRYYKACLELVNQIPTIDLYNETLKLYKMRTSIKNDLFNNIVPYEIKYPIYFSKFNEKDYEKLDLFLEKNYGG